MSRRNRFNIGELIFILGLLMVLPAMGAARATKRGVRWSYVFLTLAILGLIVRIVWVAANK